MSFTRVEETLSLKAASAVAQYVPVRLTGAETFQIAASNNADVLGVTLASAGAGDVVAVAIRGIVKGICGASLGAGARVAVSSSNGVLGPIAASGVASGAPAAAPPRYTVGRALVDAAVGDYFAVLLDPKQIV
jgi:hypothetical protein